MFTNEKYCRIIVNRNYNNTDIKDRNEIYTVVTQITTRVVRISFFVLFCFFKGLELVRQDEFLSKLFSVYTFVGLCNLYSLTSLQLVFHCPSC